MLIGHNTSGLISLNADEAIAPGLRVKWGATPGKTVSIAGDEACIGIAFNRSFKAGDPITVLDIKSLGTLPFTCSGAIAIGDTFSSDADGQVQSGTGGAEVYDTAFSATTASPQQLEGSSGQ